MKKVLVLASLLAVLAPTSLYSQESSGAPKALATQTAREFSGIGPIRVVAEYIPAPSGKDDNYLTENEIEDIVESELRGREEDGSLPAKIQVVVNTFRSRNNGDQLFTMEVRLVRPAVILGSTDIVDATVHEVETVGRCSPSDFKEFLSRSVRENVQSLRKFIR